MDGKASFYYSVCLTCQYMLEPPSSQLNAYLKLFMTKCTLKCIIKIIIGTKSLELSRLRIYHPSFHILNIFE